MEERGKESRRVCSSRVHCTGLVVLLSHNTHTLFLSHTDSACAWTPCGFRWQKWWRTTTTTMAHAN